MKKILFLAVMVAPLAFTFSDVFSQQSKKAQIIDVKQAGLSKVRCPQGCKGEQEEPGPAGPAGPPGPAGSCVEGCDQQNLYFVWRTVTGKCGGAFSNVGVTTSLQFCGPASTTGGGISPFTARFLPEPCGLNDEFVGLSHYEPPGLTIHAGSFRLTSDGTFTTCVDSGAAEVASYPECTIRLVTACVRTSSTLSPSTPPAPPL